MSTKFLTKEDIIETTGIERTEEITELEILFLSFDEISALQCCPNLRRLTLIDNGLRRISNLSPVAMSLQILCLCDQAIDTMDYFPLPHLKELYLHRNNIRKIEGLEGCPSLRKLWLFQNQISDISGLDAAPDLEELWLQANEIKSLTGIEMNPSLTSLGLAGNRIADLREIRKLSCLTRLKDISFTDIHFGRCPIADEEGYREYFVLQLRQVRILDGVPLRNDAIVTAEDAYFKEMSAFHESLQTIEEVYQKNLRAIELQHQSRESYSQVLEKEMSVALKELQTLVDEGRKIVKKEIDHSGHLIESNLNSLQTALSLTEKKSEAALFAHTQQLAEEYWHSMNLVHLLEMVEINHVKVMQLLTEVQQYSLKTSNNSVQFAFQYLGNNAADFVLVATLLDTSRVLYSSNNNNSNANANDMQVTDAESTKSTPRNRRVSSSSQAGNTSLPTVNTSQGPEGRSGLGNNEDDSNANVQNIVTKPLELARLYRVVRLDSGTNNNVSQSKAPLYYRRMFTIVGLDTLSQILRLGWSGLGAASSPATTLIFSEDAEMLSYLYESHGALQQLQVPISSEVAAVSDRAEEDLFRLLKTTAASSSSSVTAPGEVENAAMKWNPLGKAVVLLSCHVACDTSDDTPLLVSTAANRGTDASVTSTANIALPTHPSQRQMLLEELQASQKPRTLYIRNRPVPNNNNSSNNKQSLPSSRLYTLPPAALANITTSSPAHHWLIAEFVALAISHQQFQSSNGPGSTSNKTLVTKNAQQPLLKNIEGRLELLLLPTHHVTAASQLLSTYESESQTLLQRYVDQLMEGVDAQQAQVFRQAEQELLQQEETLKTLREDIENERKGQETLLRELKNSVAIENVTGTGSTMQSSGSSKQLRSRR